MDQTGKWKKSVDRTWLYIAAGMWLLTLIALAVRLSIDQ